MEALRESLKCARSRLDVGTELSLKSLEVEFRPSAVGAILPFILKAAGCLVFVALVLFFVLRERPPFSTDPVDQTVNVGEGATFTVAAKGGGLIYQWQKEGQKEYVSVPGGTKRVYSIPSVQTL